MKKVIRLTESDLVRLVKRVISEQIQFEIGDEIPLIRKRDGKDLGMFKILKSEPAAGSVYVTVKKLNGDPTLPSQFVIRSIGSSFYDITFNDVKLDKIHGGIGTDVPGHSQRGSYND